MISDSYELFDLQNKKYQIMKLAKKKCFIHRKTDKNYKNVLKENTILLKY